MGYSADRIEPGHSVRITVSGHPELSQSVVVRHDGTTEYPLLAGVPIDGLTADDVRDLLFPILIRFESEPNVFVTISETQLVKFQIQGMVERPGAFSAESPLNLQQALLFGGGIAAGGDSSNVRILRIKNGARTEESVDLNKLFRGEDLSLAPGVDDGDVIIVPRRRQENSLRVFGAVNGPGAYYVSAGDNVLDAIISAGGFASNADQRRIMLFTSSDGIPVRSNIDLRSHIYKGRYAELPTVVPGDMIVVPQISEWRSFRGWIYWISDLSILATAIIVLSRF